jgi:phosphoribosylformylglycinamidine synthase subunit PurL
MITLDFHTMTDDAIRASLAEHRIGLTIAEAKAVQNMLGRAPTVTEAVIWGIQGSEHCSYKSSRRFLKGFITTGKHVILGPKEDSGIIAITDGPVGKRWGIVVSHESHNHPSQIVPYEGAATGVGGCVRDVLCMGARVIGSLDSLRLGDLESSESRGIATEVIRGIAGYGNALGIPNLGGDTVFDSAFNESCLVNVVTVGLIREDEIIHSYVPDEAGTVGYDIILVGKATDRSGFGGAAFSSVIMSAEDSEANAGAVQEPNPFLERHLLASSYALFDWLKKEGKLDKVSFKDLGAGGVVCSSVEQVAPKEMGAIIDLEKVHTALSDLPPQVIACAETQERFCWMCHPSLTESILHHYNVIWDLPSVSDNARASVIGKVIPENRYTLMYKGEAVCDAKSTDITSGLQYVRPTQDPKRSFDAPDIRYHNGSVDVLGQSFSLQEIAETMIVHPNYASKERVFRHYDKNILGNGLIEAGEADSSVLLPLADIQSYETEVGHPEWNADLPETDRTVGVAIASGGNSRYGRVSPYLQGLNAVAENVRNIAAVGARPRAITDCLNYGNPEIPEHLFALEEGVRGIIDASKALGEDGEAIPVISGNVSLYNATKDGSIDPTANVCIVGTLPDGHKAISAHLQSADSVLLLIGERKDECGASAYHAILEVMTGCPTNALLGGAVPHPDLFLAARENLLVTEWIRAGLVRSAHDVSDGGLLLALFEMTTAIRGKTATVGASIDLSSFASALPLDTLLFSETGGFVLEVNKADVDTLRSRAEAANVPCTLLGTTTNDATLTISVAEAPVLSLSLPALHAQWSTSLERALGSL